MTAIDWNFVIGMVLICASLAAIVAGTFCAAVRVTRPQRDARERGVS